MNDQHKRICAIRAEEEGKIAAVWLAHDTISDLVTVYDACEFNREVLAVIAAGLNARGRWIPIAWEKSSKELADKLLNDHGCKMLHDPVVETASEAEMLSRDVWERMRTSRFKVEKRLKDWQKEFELLREEKGQVPVSGFPLMAATRYAISELKYAKRLKSIKSSAIRAPKLAII